MHGPTLKIFIFMLILLSNKKKNVKYNNDRTLNLLRNIYMRPLVVY